MYDLYKYHDIRVKSLRKSSRITIVYNILCIKYDDPKAAVIH